MASDYLQGGGLLSHRQGTPGKDAAPLKAKGEVPGATAAVAIAPVAAVYESPAWMKAYGMPIAISCSVGYSLIGLVMVEPTAPGALFHPAAILTLLGFAAGFLKGMQWWTAARESGRALTCPHCGVRTRLEALARACTSHTCRCGKEFSRP